MTYVRTFLRCCLFSVVSLWSSAAHGQHEGSIRRPMYTPRPVYKQDFKPLLNDIDKRLNAEVRGQSGVYQMNDARKRYLHGFFDKKQIILDDTLQQMLDRIVRRLEKANHLPEKRRHVFIVRNPIPNAECLGGGVILINVGLLGRTTSEEQIAFTLAHEIAHDELNHVPDKMRWLAEQKFSSRQKTRIKAMFTGAISLKEIHAFRSLNFAFARETRARETAADSLGFVFYSRAGYNKAGALEMLEILENQLAPKYPLKVDAFLPLHSREYPFEDHWLAPRLSVYGKSLENSFLFNLDSMLTHPNIPDRKVKIRRLEVVPAEVSSTTQFSEEILRGTEFDVVDAAFTQKAFDVCLLQALMLWQKYPRDPFLVSRIAGVLLQLYVAKADERVNLYLNTRTVGYSAELRLINDLLHNLTTRETGDLLYHFLRNPDHFDPSTRDHYYILWKFADLTLNEGLEREMRDRFKDAFGKNITSHSYPLETMDKLNIIDFYLQWGWVLTGS